MFLARFCVYLARLAAARGGVCVQPLACRCLQRGGRKRYKDIKGSMFFVTCIDCITGNVKDPEKKQTFEKLRSEKKIKDD